MVAANSFGILKLNDEISIYKKSVSKKAEKNTFNLVGSGRINSINDKFMTVKMAAYSVTVSIFELRKGDVKIVKDNKPVKFKPLEDEKKKAIERGQLEVDDNGKQVRGKNESKKATVKNTNEICKNDKKTIDNGESADINSFLIKKLESESKPKVERPVKKYYIASSLENAEQVQLLSCILNSWGWQHTYDWTSHGSIQGQGMERTREVAQCEMEGVNAADTLIMLMPGGRGTHVELGIACAAGKEIIIYASSDEEFFCSSRMCAFYTLPNIKVISGKFTKLIELLRVKENVLAS